MNRTNFLVSLLTAAPLAALANLKTTYRREKKGFKVRAGEGRYHGNIRLKGVNQNVLDVKISGKDTDGDLAIFEQTSLSPGRGTPLHVHLKQDEVFYVLEGQYGFLVGSDKFKLSQGESIFLPRQVPHSWIQLSQRGRMTVTLQPAGKLEEFFVTMAAINHEPTPQEIAAVFANHEMMVVGPPVKPSDFDSV